jgi:hypothetical protein
MMAVRLEQPRNGEIPMLMTLVGMMMLAEGGVLRHAEFAALHQQR